MKKNLHTLAVFFISVLWLLPATGQTTFYDPAVIQTIEIEFKESNWDEIMDNNLTIGDGNDLLKGKLTINKTEVFNNIGVRYKGNSSYKPNQKKNPLHIDLNYLVPGQDYQSYNTIKLSKTTQPLCARYLVTKLPEIICPLQKLTTQKYISTANT